MNRQTKRSPRTVVLTHKGKTALLGTATASGLVRVPLLEIPMRDDRRDLRTGDGR